MTADPGGIAPDHWAGSSPRWGAGTWMSPSVALPRRRVGQSAPTTRGEKRTGQAGAGVCWGAFFNSLLVNRRYDAGVHSVIWDGRDNSGGYVPSGAYLMVYGDKQGTQSRKLVIVR